MGLSKLVVSDDSNCYYYWISDLKLFSGKTYQEQQNVISSLNSDNYGGINSWKMASQEQMVLLWNYSAEDIANSFVHTLVEGGYYYNGRFELIGNLEGEHCCARVFKPVNAQEPCEHHEFYEFQDDQQRADIGAWVISKIDKSSSLSIPKAPNSLRVE